LVSNGTNRLNLFHQFKLWPPQLHQHLQPHSTCHLNNKTYPLTPLAPVSILLQPVLVGGYWIQATSTNK